MPLGNFLPGTDVPEGLFGSDHAIRLNVQVNRGADVDPSISAYVTPLRRTESRIGMGGGNYMVSNPNGTSGAAITTCFARFARETPDEALPDHVVHAVQRSLLDYAGVVAAGTTHPAHGMILQLLSRVGAKGPCRVVGSTTTTDAVNAALANGLSAHVLDWDDTILPARIHLSATLIPPLLAAGELNGWTLRQLIPAIAIGFEIQARISYAIYPSIHQRRWHSTSVVACPGVAAAAGRLLGSDVRQIAFGMGIAANGASGLMSSFGSMSKALNVGRAGALGLQSAYLASFGFISHEDTIDAGGYLMAFDSSPKLELLINGLGERWAIDTNGFKPYPCGFVAHATIDAVRQLRRKTAGREATRIRIRVAPEAMQLMGTAEPRNELEAKFSLRYAAAVAWVQGDVTPAAFNERAIEDPRHKAAMQLITIETSKDVAQDAAYVDADFSGGAVESVHVPRVRGTDANPLTDDDLLEKYRAARALAGLDRGDELARLIMGSNDLNCAALMDLLCQPKA